jgi:hypothetical protein
MIVRFLAILLLLCLPFDAAKKCFSQDSYYLDGRSYKVETGKSLRHVNNVSIRVRFTGYKQQIKNTSGGISEKLSELLVNYADSVSNEPYPSSPTCKVNLEISINSKPVPNSYNYMYTDYSIQSVGAYTSPDKCKFISGDTNSLYTINNFNSHSYEENLTEVYSNLRIIIKDFLSKTRFNMR